MQHTETTPATTAILYIEAVANRTAAQTTFTAAKTRKERLEAQSAYEFWDNKCEFCYVESQRPAVQS